MLRFSKFNLLVCLKKISERDLYVVLNSIICFKNAVVIITTQLVLIVMRYMLRIFNIFGMAYKLPNWKLYWELTEGNTKDLPWRWANGKQPNQKRAPPSEIKGTLMQIWKTRGWVLFFDKDGGLFYTTSWKPKGFLMFSGGMKKAYDLPAFIFLLSEDFLN